MKFIKKVKESNDSQMNGSVTAAFLGDSITHGVFELTYRGGGEYGYVFDFENVYHNIFKKKLNILFPNARINIINAGANGTDAKFGLERLDRDVLAYSPDLTVVCLGTNDSTAGAEKIEEYADNLDKIFKKLKGAGSEVIFLTPNPMADRVLYEVNINPGLEECAELIVNTQTSGTADKYFDRAKEVAALNGVPVCDCRAKWYELKSAGVDITSRLCNHLNHPSREMHELFALMLIDVIIK